ncbi:MAG: DUF86 domain-containing protein [Patescibacteria group bacterium]|nr:DUF86 domain-containing protein [Patescibacteria group bacterium]
MGSRLKKIKLLKNYFKKKPEVLMAFVFGSQAKSTQMKESDWDIGVYFKPKEYLELESNVEEYGGEENIWSDLVDILQTDNVDLVVLNRAKSSVVYSAITTGMPLIIKDYKLYYDLLCKAGYEAMDWWQFVNEFYEISKQARSLGPEARARVRERLDFLKRQFQDIDQFRELTWDKYRYDTREQRNVERWVENLIMAAIDIAKIVLASDKHGIPQGYRDTLKLFIAFYVDKKLADRFANFAKLRNIIAHEYLDIRWKQIKKFIDASDELYPKFIEKVDTLLKKN